jgi:hypothetical protein
MNSPVRVTSTLDHITFKFQDAYTSVPLISTLQGAVVISSGCQQYGIYIILFIIIYLFTAIGFAPGGSSPTLVQTKTIKQHYTVVQHNTIKRKHKIIRT